MYVAEDWGVVGGCMEGEEALRLRDLVGLSEARVGAGVDVVLTGSSTMYIGVSKSRNSVHPIHQPDPFPDRQPQTYQLASAHPQ